MIYESSLRTGNFHKKSYFEGYFNFLKFSDARCAEHSRSISIS